MSYITLADLRQLWPDLPETVSDEMAARAIDEAIMRLGYAPDPDVTREIAKLAVEYLLGKRQMG